MLQKLSVLILLVFSAKLTGQPLTQSIRGTIIDEGTNQPLAYATVSLHNTSLGTVTDSLGNFIIENIAIGRYNILVSYLGYESVLLNEIQVTSAKEVFLTVFMKESINALEEVIIKPKVNKEQPLNRMATASARMLSVEEAKRYAGGFDDPARLVSAFAGVSSNVGNNAIIVRGNSPQSLQWKLEGVEIPNPNHFADLAAFGGGGLTALSAQLLANSDFFSGAMPAEYMNALSGVFDLYMRNGNNQKHEHTLQVGAIGIDIASEGPLKKYHPASYIFNYRYSTLGLLQPILPENSAGTTYQDLSFKFNYPSKKRGTFTLWGMGLLDHSDATAKDDPLTWQYAEDQENQDANQSMGAAGISHKIIVNEKQYLKSISAITCNGIALKSEILDRELLKFPKNEIANSAYNLILSSALHTKFSAKHTNKSGFVITEMNYDLLLKSAPTPHTSLQTLVNESGHSTLFSAFSQSAIQVNAKTNINVGINGQWFSLKQDFSFEPRLGIKYHATDRHVFSFAYGLHSRLERLNYYFIKNNLQEFVNKDLGFTKSHHVILGYDMSLSEYSHLKVETYYQHLFHVPVITGSTFSLINQQNDWFFSEQLENKGLGKNYGLEITFDKYISKGYYYMASGSLFNSRYKGGDHMWRNTRYNHHFVFNFLIGKEWWVGRKKNKLVSVNGRLNIRGSDYYSPINMTQSLASQEVIYDETMAFTKQHPPAIISHFTTSYKINKPKTVHELALKIINLTQYRDYLGYRYNFLTKTVDINREAIFIPNVSYKIEF